MRAPRTRPVLAAILGAMAASVAPAQSFDNFGEGPLDGFEFDPEASDGAEMPSLGEDGTMPDDGDGVTLDITPGQSGVGLSVFPGTGSAVTSVSQPATAQAERVTLRALDRMLGQPTDVEMAVGETVMFGRIAVHVIECRYPQEDPASDAFAHVEILDLEGNALFDGWMIASSPALNALEHPRYDVWVLGCTDPG
jgi:hypothetical protein